MADLPAIRFAVRDGVGVQFFTAPFSNTMTPDNAEHVPCGEKGFLFTGDGARFACIEDARVCVYDTASLALVCVMPRGKVQRAAWSPLGSFLQTWERQSIHSDGGGNLIVWRVAGCADGCDSLIEQRFFEKEIETQWPVVQWTHDERCAMRMEKNALCVFDGQAGVGKKALAKVACENITQFEVASLTTAAAAAAEHYTVATFTPVRTTSPAWVNILSLERGGDGRDVITHKSLTKKSFFKADSVQLSFNDDASALLVQAETETTKDSYYGDSSLYLLYADGKASVNVPFGSNKGPLQDVQVRSATICD
jgi:uncharacterized protein with WD repeat